MVFLELKEFKSAVYYVVQGGSNFWFWMKSLSVTIKLKAAYWAVLFRGTVLYTDKVVLTCEFVDEILKCDHSNED